MRHDPQMILKRAEALNVGCEYCHAQPQQRCFNPKTKFDLEFQPAHFVRLQALNNLARDA